MGCVRNILVLLWACFTFTQDVHGKKIYCKFISVIGCCAGVDWLDFHCLLNI